MIKLGDFELCVPLEQVFVVLLTMGSLPKNRAATALRVSKNFLVKVNLSLFEYSEFFSISYSNFVRLGMPDWKSFCLIPKLCDLFESFSVILSGHLQR